MGNKKVLYIFLAIAGMLSSVFCVPVFAEEKVVSKENEYAVYELSMNDNDPLSTLKSKYLQKKSEDGLNLINVDLENTKFSTNGLDVTNSGLQNVHVEMLIAEKSNSNVSYSDKYIENILVNVKISKVPQLVLKQTKTNIAYQSDFNPTDYIELVSDVSGNLPVLSIESNVNTQNEGTYEVNYAAINQLGNRTTAKLSVIVKKTAEQLAAEEEARIQAELEAQQAAEEARQQEIYSAQKVASASYVYDGPTTATGQTLVNIARSWCGTGIYAYGGNNPATGTDCSGFTQYVYAQVGISIDRIAAGQANNGYYTTNPQPGDLVLWTNHAGIYSGNGNLINALNPNLGIGENSISAIQGSGAFLGYYHVYGVE